MEIYEDDVYEIEHIALQRIENLVWRMELDEKQLHRIAGFIAGIRAVGGALLDKINEDHGDTD